MLNHANCFDFTPFENVKTNVLPINLVKSHNLENADIVKQNHDFQSLEIPVNIIFDKDYNLYFKPHGGNYA